MDQTNTLLQDWIFNTAPGQTGVDATYIGPPATYPGFTYAELKPLSINGWETFWKQLEAWTLPAEETQLWFYNPGGVIGSSGNNY